MVDMKTFFIAFFLLFSFNALGYTLDSCEQKTRVNVFTFDCVKNSQGEKIGVVEAYHQEEKTGEKILAVRVGGQILFFRKISENKLELDISNMI